MGLYYMIIYIIFSVTKVTKIGKLIVLMCDLSKVSLFKIALKIGCGFILHACLCYVSIVNTEHEEK